VSKWIGDLAKSCSGEAQVLSVRPDVTLKEVAELLRFCDRYQVGGLADLGKMIRSRAQVLKNNHKLTEGRRARLREEYNAVKRTKGLAVRSALFENVEYHPSPKIARKEKARANARAGSGGASAPFNADAGIGLERKEWPKMHGPGRGSEGRDSKDVPTPDKRR
jgi:hypothetical protein